MSNNLCIQFDVLRVSNLRGKTSCKTTRYSTVFLSILLTEDALKSVLVQASVRFKLEKLRQGKRLMLTLHILYIFSDSYCDICYCTNSETCCRFQWMFYSLMRINNRLDSSNFGAKISHCFKSFRKILIELLESRVLELSKSF